MHIVAIAWAYVVLMMVIVEALSSNGSVLGALFTLLLYGVLPLGIVLYVMGTPMRRRMQQRTRRKAEQREQEESAAQPDGSGHAPGDPVAPVGKEI